MPLAPLLFRLRLPVLAGLCSCLAVAHAQTPEFPDANASGVFLNAAGDVLTARHVVADCRTLFAIKGAQVAEATVVAASPELDLAVLRTTLKPYLHATLALGDAAPGQSIGVFAEAYAVLQRLPGRATLLSNAMTVPGAEGLHLLSGLKPGASGSAVLGGRWPAAWRGGGTRGRGAACQWRDAEPHRLVGCRIGRGNGCDAGARGAGLAGAAVSSSARHRLLGKRQSATEPHAIAGRARVDPLGRRALRLSFFPERPT
jgi:hypothetical protein